MGLYAENDVLVGAAPRLLTQEQPGGQARRLARHRHVVRSPRLAVLVRHSRACDGGPVPDALLGPETERKTNLKLGTKAKVQLKLKWKNRPPEGICQNVPAVKGVDGHPGADWPAVAVKYGAPVPEHHVTLPGKYYSRLPGGGQKALGRWRRDDGDRP